MDRLTPILLGYIGPETMLPLASALAAVTGFILIFWRFIMNSVRRLFCAVFRRKRKDLDAKTAAAGPSKTSADRTASENKTARGGAGDATE